MVAPTMDPDFLRVIVVALDLSPASDEALRTAHSLASKHPASSVHLIHVLAGELELAFADERLAEWAARFSTIEANAEFHTIQRADVAAAIVEEAARLQADLIVVGTAGRRGLSRFVLGSVAEQVVRTAGCPVLVAREKAHPDVSES